MLDQGLTLNTKRRLLHEFRENPSVWIIKSVVGSMMEVGESLRMHLDPSSLP